MKDATQTSLLNPLNRQLQQTKSLLSPPQPSRNSPSTTNSSLDKNQIYFEVIKEEAPQKMPQLQQGKQSLIIKSLQQTSLNEIKQNHIQPPSHKSIAQIDLLSIPKQSSQNVIINLAENISESKIGNQILMKLDSFKSKQGLTPLKQSFSRGSSINVNETLKSTNRSVLNSIKSHLNPPEIEDAYKSELNSKKVSISAPKSQILEQVLKINNSVRCIRKQSLKQNYLHVKQNCQEIEFAKKQIMKPICFKKNNRRQINLSFDLSQSVLNNYQRKQLDQTEKIDTEFYLKKIQDKIKNIKISQSLDQKLKKSFELPQSKSQLQTVRRKKVKKKKVLKADFNKIVVKSKFHSHTKHIYINKSLN